MRLPASAMLTGVSANRLRPWAHLPPSPGITVRLANPRRLIDPSASRTRLHLKKSGWKKEISPTSFITLPALRARASVGRYTIIASTRECSQRHWYAAPISPRIGARSGQPQQEGESHLPEDR